MAITDSAGLPVAVHIQSASLHEVRLVEETLDRRFLEAQPKKLIGDKAYDSDGLTSLGRGQAMAPALPSPAHLHNAG